MHNYGNCAFTGGREDRSKAADTDLPCVSRVGIVGLGAIGVPIGLPLVADGLDCAGFDTNPEHMRQALARRAVSRTVGRLVELADCDVIFLCVPPGCVVEVASELRPYSNATFIDVASAKAFLADAIKDPKFVLSHPMRGSNRSGPTTAKEGLFRGGPWVISPLATTSGESLRIAERLIRRLGAFPILMDPRTHDRICARTSHLPHILASALALTALSKESTEAHLLAGASLKDLTRIAHGNPLLWRDVTTTNKEAIVPVLTECIARMTQLLQDLDNDDTAAVERFFCTAAERVEELLSRTTETTPARLGGRP